MATTRTIGPLHLEDLEPHRFEDLVRQLIYDFRNWRALEATGRAGSDDGFDARGFEIVANTDEPSDRSGDEDAEAEAPVMDGDRIWLIQCKRERSIGPKKLVGHLNDIPEAERPTLYGLVFAAACDFSKSARDGFRASARELGFGEAYLWGKAEMEDLLFQPKNDHLLFAYFGISLQVRRRTLRAEVRAKLAAKRKVHRLLNPQMAVLIRDMTDDRYPYLDGDRRKPREQRGRWAVMTYHGKDWDGLHFIVHRHFAYLGDDGKEWDFAECMDDGHVSALDNPWSERGQRWNDPDRQRAMAIWDTLLDQNKAWYEIHAVLPYEHVIDVDEHGDELFRGPQIYVSEFSPRMGPFHGFRMSLETISHWSPRSGDDVKENRVEKFPRKSSPKEPAG